MNPVVCCAQVCGLRTHVTSVWNQWLFDQFVAKKFSFPFCILLVFMPVLVLLLQSRPEIQLDFYCQVNLINEV